MRHKIRMLREIILTRPLLLKNRVQNILSAPKRPYFILLLWPLRLPYYKYTVIGTFLSLSRFEYPNLGWKGKVWGRQERVLVERHKVVEHDLSNH